MSSDQTWRRLVSDPFGDAARWILRAGRTGSPPRCSEMDETTSSMRRANSPTGSAAPRGEGRSAGSVLGSTRFWPMAADGRVCAMALKEAARQTDLVDRHAIARAAYLGRRSISAKEKARVPAVRRRGPILVWLPDGRMDRGLCASVSRKAWHSATRC